MASSPRGKCDVLIHYDEERAELRVLTVDTAQTVELRARDFPPAFPVADFLADPPDDVERRMGELVFTLIDYHAGKPIGVRDYRALTEAAMAEYRAQLRAKVEEGDAESQYFLATELLSDAIRHAREADLHEADRLIRASAAQGFADAVERLNGRWPRDLESLLPVIRRRHERGSGKDVD